MTKQKKSNVFGADIGNYSSEIFNEEWNLLQPSIVAFQSTVFGKTEGTLEQAIFDLPSNLKVHIKSDENNIDSFFFVGDAAVNNGDSFKRSMDISVIEKSNSDIPIIMLCSLFATRKIQEEYYEKHSITESEKNYSFDEVINLTTAIPASEFTPDRAKKLEDKLRTNHTVTVYFADFKVTVNIRFDFVKVTEEGKTGMLYLTNLVEPDRKLATVNYIEKYNKDLVTTDTTYSLHVDIGNGTTEFTFIKGVNPIRSKGVNLGIGHAIEAAIQVFSTKLNVDIERQAFVQLLQGDSRKALVAQECLTKSLNEFKNQLLVKIKGAIQTLTQGQMDFLFVHGGGSIMLESEIIEDLFGITDNNLAELVYISADYAPHLNARGCYELCNILMKQAA